MAVCAGVSFETLRLSAQKHLFGDSEHGTGLIPKECISDIRMRQGMPDCIRTVKIKHSSGGISVLECQAYEQGRDKFQAYTADVMWLDEEPTDEHIFTECLTRTATTNGIIMVSFTPLYGLSNVVLKFTDDGLFPPNNVNKAGNWVVNITWDEDIPHLTQKAKDALLANYDEYERDARSKGIPQLGSGRIYPFVWEDISVPRFEIPDWWPRCAGFDDGQFAGIAWLAQDPNNGVWYVYDIHLSKRDNYLINVSLMKAHGDYIWYAYDPSADKRTQPDGKKFIDLYREEDINLTKANNAVESGIATVRSMLECGRLKFFSHLTELMKEFLTYRWDEKGKVVKIHDHILDAVRYACMTGIKYGISYRDSLEKVSNSSEVDGIGSRDNITGY